MRKSLISLSAGLVVIGTAVLIAGVWFSGTLPNHSADETGQNVAVSIASELEKHALLPFEDDQLSQPSTAQVFIDPDGVLLAFEADFGPPENYRSVAMHVYFDPSDIGVIRLEGNELRFACLGGAKCIKTERHTELSMPIVRTFVDAPRQEDKLVISLASAALAVQQRMRDAFVRGFESLGVKLAR